MKPQPPPSGRTPTQALNPVLRGLVTLGGALTFCFGGGSVGYFVGIGILQGDSIHNSSSPGAAIAGVIMFGLATLVGAIVGAVLGYGLFAWMGQHPKLIWVQLPFAVFGYGALIFGGVRLAQMSSMIKADVKAGEAIRSKSERDIAAQNQTFIKEAKTDLIPLMGNLIYPGSEIAGGLSGSKTYPSVALTTNANAQSIESYYRPMLSEATGSGVTLKGRLIRPGDGRTVLFSLTQAKRGYQLYFVTVAASPSAVPPESPPSETNTSTAQSSLESDPGWPVASSNGDLTTAYGNLIYPGSHTNFASTTPPRADVPASLVALASADSMSKVVTYYRPLVEVKVDTPDQFTGMTSRSSDGRRAFVSVRTKDGLTMITLSAD